MKKSNGAPRDPYTEPPDGVPLPPLRGPPTRSPSHSRPERAAYRTLRAPCFGQDLFTKNSPSDCFSLANPVGEARTKEHSDGRHFLPGSRASKASAYRIARMGNISKRTRQSKRPLYRTECGALRISSRATRGIFSPVLAPQAQCALTRARDIARHTAQFDITSATMRGGFDI